MGVNYNPNIVTDSLVLHLDANNPRSYSPNSFSRPLDITGWYRSFRADGVGNNCTVEPDPSTAKSPAGGIPMKMNITGNDPHLDSVNASARNIAPAKAGQTWVVSVYAKSSTTTTDVGEIFVFGANSSGVSFVDGDWLNIASKAITFTTSWTRFDVALTLTNPSVEYIQIRLDGPNSGGAGTSVWWDGLQVELSSSGLPTAFNPQYNPNRATWKDLSENGRNFTMFGAVPFSEELEENAGFFDFTDLTPGFSGDSPLGFVPTVDGLPFSSTGSFTISSWINQTAGSGQTGLFSNAGNISGFRFGPSSGGIYYLVGPPYNEGVIGSGSFSLNEWTLITAVFDRQSQLNSGPGVYAYVNGNLVGSVQLAGQTEMQTGNASIVRGPCCGRFIGKLSTMSVYDKALSDREVKRIFDIYRGRYGI